MTLSIDAILSQAENPAFVRVATAWVLLRQDLASQLSELNRLFNRALKEDPLENREPLAPGYAQQIEVLEREIEDAKVPFKFKAIGRRAWADLLAQYPPTLEQRRQYDDKVDHNPDTFPLAAIAATSAEPVMTYEQVERLDKVLNDSQFQQLWVACLDANKGDAPPKSTAAGLIRRAKGRSDASATDTESPDQSTSDEPVELESSL